MPQRWEARMRLVVLFAVSLICALCAMQMPEFIQQYSQRLGGALDELDRVVQNFDEDARQRGYDETGALGLLKANPVPLVQDQSARMSETIARRDRLRAQKDAIAAGGVGAFATFLAHYDPPLAARTWDTFRFGLPLNSDGLLFAFFGFVTSFLTLGLGGLALRGVMVRAA
jgi:hypothetical protein